LDENNESFQKELIQFLHRTENVDPDKVMLNSFLPYVKNLNNAQKLDFQLYVLKYFKNLEANSIQTSPNQTNPIITNTYSALGHYYNSPAVTQPPLYPSQSTPNNSELTFPQQNYDFLNYPHSQCHSSNSSNNQK